MSTFILQSLIGFSALTAARAATPSIPTTNGTVPDLSALNIPVAGFVPEKLPAFVALGMYGLSALVLWIQFFRFGRPSFMLSLTIGMTSMAAGFILRIMVSNSPFNLGLFVTEDLFILLSPCLFLATDYVLLARLTATFSERITSRALLVRPSLIVKIFIISDVLTFLIQASGGSLSTSHNINTSNLGTNVTIVGLVLQLVSFVFFATLTFVFGWRVQREFPRAWNSRADPLPLSFTGTESSNNWRLLYWTMCITCIGILIRSVFRIAELSGGYLGFLALHEGFFYIFDASVLWISMTLYCFVWPTRFLGGRQVGENEEEKINEKGSDDFNARGQFLDI
ncbi:RTA1 like protein-domain-containing protein [Roridomyces roridus]|uniref:RTA1 like protein-domain-containing protein n=1 Tax=Roridomyces roridus TaxID=1738132 RepID=A0AAD7BI96_9AGAR|nr:RTA1 like protein-domain-containing protein [Roridomyces roridus]